MKTVRIFKTIAVVSIFFGSQMSLGSAPQTYRTAAEIETSCRIKAKEVAAEAYRSCVTDQKTSQIEQIKKEYADKLNALKLQYEEELKKLASQNSKNSKSKTNIKSAKKSAGEKAKPAPQQAAVAAPPAQTEMKVELKAAPGEPMTDESALDLPEPIPVDDSALN